MSTNKNKRKWRYDFAGDTRGEWSHNGFVGEADFINHPDREGRTYREPPKRWIPDEWKDKEPK